MKTIRLNKYIAGAGVSSRRYADRIIESGRITINGEIVTRLGVTVNPDKDDVRLDGERLVRVHNFIYVMLHKPKGCVTTARDQFDRRTVMDYISDIDARLFPVGRLDYNTSGILLLTNDGEFANKLTHPSHKINKTYIARVTPNPSEDALQKLRRGVRLDEDGTVTAPADISVLKINERFTIFKITISEGRNRQIHRMCEAVGIKVLSLHRIKIGGLELSDLPPCAYRIITKEEAKKALLFLPILFFCLLIQVFPI